MKAWAIGSFPPEPVSDSVHTSWKSAPCFRAAAGSTSMTSPSWSGFVGFSATGSAPGAVTVQWRATSAPRTGWLKWSGMRGRGGSRSGAMPHTPSTSSGRLTKLKWKSPVRPASAPVRRTW